MPGTRRRGVVPRRRRREDEGEDESSVAGDLDDFSMSEGSAISNGDDEADVEGSDVSAEDEEARTSVAGTKIPEPVIRVQSPTASISKSDVPASTAPRVGARAVTNGLQHTDSTVSNVAHREQVGESNTSTAERASASAPQLSQPQEALTEKSKREHLEYVKQRDSNPAFVPNRGGFFLHDDRSGASSSPYGRPFPRGRGRGFNGGYGVGRGYGQAVNGPTDRPWAHDLHDTVNKTVGSPPLKDPPATFQIPTAKPATTAPNRTFSVSSVLGNVTVQVYLPGMDTKKVFQSLVKKQHTLLPQHRPPLRRDKPVRISIPNEDPRYIFPSTERSFIFIPRAMRPNQQTYPRGRGRGSFQGSRRASIMGSVYTPSIAMSRRSSLGGAGSTGIRTPTDGVIIPRGPMIQTLNRPVVRMPVAPVVAPGIYSSSGPVLSVPMVSLPLEQSHPGSTILHSPTVTLPMYQPRPQKTVSVAEIESPAVKAPQQQQEQPFHQQMPPGVSLMDGPLGQQGQPATNMAMNAPLSHIPEGAVYAQPFQPYPVYPQGGYYGPTFPGGPMMYHTPADPYGMGMGGPVLPPQFTPTQNFVPASQTTEAGHTSAMMLETNGMVYYYDPTQYPNDGSQMGQYPMAVGGGMVGVPAPGTYFYPAVPGGLYYSAAQ